MVDQLAGHLREQIHHKRRENVFRWWLHRAEASHPLLTGLADEYEHAVSLRRYDDFIASEVFKLIGFEVDDALMKEFVDHLNSVARLEDYHVLDLDGKSAADIYIGRGEWNERRKDDFYIRGFKRVVAALKLHDGTPVRLHSVRSDRLMAMAFTVKDTTQLLGLIIFPDESRQRSQDYDVRLDRKRRTQSAQPSEAVIKGELYLSDAE